MAIDKEDDRVFILNVRIPIELRDRLDELVVVLQRDAPGVKLSRSDAVRIAIERMIAAQPTRRERGTIDRIVAASAPKPRRAGGSRR